MEFFCNPENRNKCIDKMKRVANSTSKKLNPSVKAAAVLIPLVNCEKNGSILYTLRSNKMRRHVGQVSFPGKKKNKRSLRSRLSLINFWIHADDNCNDYDLHWICLGGILDQYDASYADCALRETEEEIGIGRDRIEVWGETSLILLRETTAITPVIGMIHDYNTNLLKINDDEVERVFTVPIIGNWSD